MNYPVRKIKKVSCSSSFLVNVVISVKGTIVFVRSRILREDGLHWLKVADGWICEEKYERDSHRILAVPFISANHRKTKENDNFVDDLVKSPLSNYVAEASRSMEDRIKLIQKRLESAECQLREVSKYVKDCLIDLDEIEKGMSCRISSLKFY